MTSPFPRLLAACALVVTTPVCAQIIDTPDDSVAGIPVNYTEAKTGDYVLPDPLVLANGDRVTDARTWFEKRRPEILRLIEENQFGRAPEPPAELHFEVTDSGTSAFAGRARRKQVTINLTPDGSHYLDLLLYLPADATEPVPVLLQLGWFPNNLAVDDPGVKIGRRWDRQAGKRVAATPAEASSERRRPRGLVVEPLLERGFGTAVFHYNDVDPDSLNGFAHGIRSAYLEPGAEEPSPDGWGSIAAWAWGISRVIDYFETDPDVDAKRVAITGASRLGKTVLWAGARDDRIAAVIASVSGEGGAALSRRNYGETIAHLVAPTRYPYQFARNYQQWADRVHAMPFDAHMLIALIAPRPLLLQTGNTDKWSDPYGEFLAAKAATPVYGLLGARGIEDYSLPPAGRPLLNTLGFVMHDGGHGVLPQDWEVFLEFLEKYL